MAPPINSLLAIVVATGAIVICHAAVRADDAAAAPHRPVDQPPPPAGSDEVVVELLARQAQAHNDVVELLQQQLRAARAAPGEVVDDAAFAQAVAVARRRVAEVTRELDAARADDADRQAQAQDEVIELLHRQQQAHDEVVELLEQQLRAARAPLHEVIWERTQAEVSRLGANAAENAARARAWLHEHAGPSVSAGWQATQDSLRAGAAAASAAAAKAAAAAGAAASDAADSLGGVGDDLRDGLRTMHERSRPVLNDLGENIGEAYTEHVAPLLRPLGDLADEHISPHVHAARKAYTNSGARRRVADGTEQALGAAQSAWQRVRYQFLLGRRAAVSFARRHAPASARMYASRLVDALLLSALILTLFKVGPAFARGVLRLAGDVVCLFLCCGACRRKSHID